MVEMGGVCVIFTGSWRVANFDRRSIRLWWSMLGVE
eukprot:COSAG01_NODE_58622_length_304_cov_0.577670_1_plen_35_part_01